MWQRSLQELPAFDTVCTWTDLDHAGRVAFTKALQAVMSENAWKPVPWEAARAALERLQQRHYDPDWWRIGYVEQKMAAVVVPQRDGERGRIGFFGVVPQRRGEGLGREAVVEGLRVLAEAGLQEVVVDLEGEAGAATLKACGFEDRGSSR